ncbi:LysM peptidoglycan-binding domain-containing protein [Desulfosarcina sp.]|uniref:LysM peptidoglycan-binding domain-containing protein n=1 Tax=Desulfosarcina sp. TaxID=2027861 RepID=UPI003970616D
MKHKHICAGMGLILMVLWSCQPFRAPREMSKQAKTYIEQAQAYESQGNPVEALEQFKLAQTIDPQEPIVIESITRLEKQLDDLAETHYQNGLRYRDKGRWELAKKEFLNTLRYRPEHEKAAAMLQQRHPAEATKYITHEIGPGESVSKLALKYYGDYKKYHHIANFNNMSDATQVKVGQRILIPAIDGVDIDDLMRISTGSPVQPPSEKAEFSVHQIKPGESLSRVAEIYYGDAKLFRVIAAYNGISDPTSVKVGQKVNVPRLDQMASSGLTTAAKPAQAHPYTPEADEAEAAADRSEPQTQTGQPDANGPVDQVAQYRETGIALFNEKKYDDAILELKKVLSASPEDADAIGYVSRAYVELGRGHLTANRFNEAKTAFTTALDFDDDCRECVDLLDQCREIEAEFLGKEGQGYLQKNQIDKAISTLERAVALNPDDGATTALLFQTLFQKALVLYNQNDYLAAKTGFTKAAAVKPDCSECKQYIEASLQEYKAFHYNEGIVFFGQQDLKKAISAWEKVAAVDPGYKDVQQNLRKATLLNENLERIRKSTAE